MDPWTSLWNFILHIAFFFLKCFYYFSFKVEPRTVATLERSVTFSFLRLTGKCYRTRRHGLSSFMCEHRSEAAPRVWLTQNLRLRSLTESLTLVFANVWNKPDSLVSGLEEGKQKKRRCERQRAVCETWSPDSPMLRSKAQESCSLQAGAGLACELWAHCCFLSASGRIC